METKKLLEEFVKSRENEIATVAAFGYGSGVFKQRGNDTEKSMIDTIFVVKDAKSWHKENKKLNIKKINEDRNSINFLILGITI